MRTVALNSSPQVIRRATLMPIRYPLTPGQFEDPLVERGIAIRHEFVLFRRSRFGCWI